MLAKSEIDWKKIDEIIGAYDWDKESLLMIMQDISDLYQYVPPEVVPVLAEKLGVRKSHIFSVATFYKTISLVPRGRYIVHVCTGTACHVRGAEKVMDALKTDLKTQEGETTADGLFTLEGVRCIGCCASGPVMTVNKETHGGLDRSSALKVIDNYRNLSS
jgi:NADH:ubiquinone oxidoreductase subunit E